MAIVPWRPYGWGLRRYEPMTGVTPIEVEIDDMLSRFERMVGAPWRHSLLETRGWAPSVDMVDRKDEVVVRAEIPGMKREDIHVAVSGDLLTIQGERKAEKEAKEEDYYCCERSRGSFYRGMSLPAGVEKEKIRSTYKDGILSIHIPKAEEVKPKEVEIKVE